MKFHQTRLGTFGTSLPTDRDGYVTCSPSRVERAKAAIRAGRTATQYGATNVLVAEAELALAGWRQCGTKADSFCPFCPYDHPPGKGSQGYSCEPNGART